jgi:hypothetical protein
MSEESPSLGLELDKPDYALKSTRNLFLVDRAMVYVLIVIAAILGAYAYTLRAESIFACPASGYSSDNYLAYCHATHFGDYDHGALWFGLEPQVRERAQNAQVLFLGNSRSQFGFSSDATEHWFASDSATYYLMGFAYWENYLFEAPLLQRVKPKARVYVINIDTFFDAIETAPAKFVMHDADAADHYQSKQNWQRYHANICTRLALLCGSDQAFFRSRRTGAYLLKGGRVTHVRVSYEQSVDQKLAQDYIARASGFLADLPVERRCVVLTMVPTVHTPIGTARAIAQALGATLIAPEIQDLTTFDTSHMDRASAERWSGAFLEAAGPRINECLGK